jgi:hypothetical protein
VPYTARPQNSPLATRRTASHFAFSVSPYFQLSSSAPHARFAGHANARQHARLSPHSSSTSHPAHHRQVLPPGVEEQPF